MRSKWTLMGKMGTLKKFNTEWSEHWVFIKKSKPKNPEKSLFKKIWVNTTPLQKKTSTFKNKYTNTTFLHNWGRAKAVHFFVNTWTGGTVRGSVHSNFFWIGIFWFTFFWWTPSVHFTQCWIFFSVPIFPSVHLEFKKTFCRIRCDF